MRKKILLAIAGIGLAFGACAQTLPTFVSKTVAGTTAANIIIPQTATGQIRVVSAQPLSDLSSSLLSFYTGGTAHYTTATNSTSGTNIVLESTAGLTSTSLLYIQTPTSNFVMTANFTNATVVGFATTLPANVTIGDEVEVLTAGPVAPVGANTFRLYSSDGLFVGNYGRCVYATLNGTSLCTNSLSWHVDGTSQ
jgi:hypothetical protein